MSPAFRWLDGNGGGNNGYCVKLCIAGRVYAVKKRPDEKGLSGAARPVDAYVCRTQVEGRFKVAFLAIPMFPESIAQAIERAVLHEGKMYNFDFDFFNSDRVVCTEVIYRAYDGLEDLRIPLQERGGRKTLSAEDLLDFALETRAFTPVAIFGTKGCDSEIMYGEGVRDVLVASYR